MERIEFDGKWCAYKKIRLSWHWEKTKRFCPVCSKSIGKCGSAFLFINNYKLFPNIVCHAECIHNKVTKDTIEKLICSYKSYCKMYDKNKAWIGSSPVHVEKSK
jgi:hypothetical protein